MVKKLPVSSGAVRMSFGRASSPPRDWFGTPSVILWMLFGCSSGAIRTTLEHFPNSTRTSVEQSSGIIRRIGGKRPNLHFFWHGKPISIKLLHVLIGFMINNRSEICKPTSIPLSKKGKYDNNHFAGLESKCYFYCATNSNAITDRKNHANNRAYFV